MPYLDRSRRHLFIFVEEQFLNSAEQMSSVKAENNTIAIQTNKSKIMMMMINTKHWVVNFLSTLTQMMPLNIHYLEAFYEKQTIRSPNLADLTIGRQVRTDAMLRWTPKWDRTELTSQEKNEIFTASSC
uniref:Uncharacterized protein n=1 Tax=Romanomermis culicivorax TaxID=13658 RepID=A0A915L8M4_ROMCU